jgi:glyoxylase-like metal-dependent hydrolase (beta-lactamase superfamily II)
MEIFRLVFSPIEVNTYILSDGSGKCAVIDCGCYSPAEFERLETLIKGKSLVPELLLNTHCHPDHIFGNRMFLEKYGLRTVFHIEEEANIGDSVHIAELIGLGMDIPPEPERYIGDGAVIGFGNSVLKALLVPGHSAGSLAWYSEKDNVVFTGDALFAGSIGRTDLRGGDYDTLVTSIRTKLFTLPSETIVYPGHGEATTIGNEMKTNPYFA